MAEEDPQQNGDGRPNGFVVQGVRDEPPSPSRGSVRNTSSKIASLRAAFEKSSSPEGTTNRRFASNERSEERSQERKQAHEIEMTRTRVELEREREVRQAYEEKCTMLEEEVEELRAQIEQREDMWRQQWTQKSNEMVEQRSQSLVLDVKKSREEAGTLQRQLSDMKRSISTSTRIDSQVTDSTFAQEMGALHHEIQNWVVNSFRRAKADASREVLFSRLEKVAEPKQLEMLKPIYAAFEPSARLAVYQATVMAYLIEVFDAPLLYGLPADQEWRKRIRQASEALPSVLRPAAYNKWRATTLDLVRQSERLTEWIEAAASGMAEMICIVLSALSDTEENETRKASLNSIVKRAISLAHLFRVQRAQYEFHLPSPLTDFDPATMDGVSMDVEAHPGGVVDYATFPTVVKLGDEQGDNLLFRNVILKAKVVCREP